MTYEQILTRWHWLQLSNEQRAKMREVFNITKSGGVEMIGNKIISDGCNENDLKMVNIKTMQDFLQRTSAEDTFESLYNATIAKVDDLLTVKEEGGPQVQVVGETNPLERMKVMYEALSSEEKKSFGESITPITPINVTKEETPHGNIKKEARTKEGKKGSNLKAAEGTGEGNSSQAVTG